MDGINPKYRKGTIPNADPNYGWGGSAKKSLSSKEAHSYLWTGHILHVDVETMVCSLSLDMGGSKEVHDVPLPAPAGSGPRCWAGMIPEPGTKVLVGWKKYDDRNFSPYIIEFMTSGTLAARQYEPFSTIDPKDLAEIIREDPDIVDDPRYNLQVIRLKARKGYGGDFVASSSSGADFLLDRDVTFLNRAGNEFKLRDSDQTTVLQTINEFVSSAAGFYRRGLIRRNAFNLLPDLFLSDSPPTDLYEKKNGVAGDQDVADFLKSKIVTVESSVGTTDVVLVDQVLTDSAAFEKLSEFGLVDDTGKVIDVVMGIDPDIPDQIQSFYPYIVTGDGRRQSYVVHGEHDVGFDKTDEAYVEDRAEIFHTHDGVMSVTEEGDGVQIDHALKRVFITDVRGTVVGNDPYTDSGRTLYKKILSMGMWTSLDDMSEPHVRFFEVDTAKTPSAADRIALARLFKIKCPVDDTKQYIFGITKEGRVYLNVPGSRDLNQSIDLNADGGIKAMLGANVDRTSLNLKTLGGVKLDIGTFKDDSSDDQDSVSIDAVLQGKIKIDYAGTQGRETTIGGADYKSVAGTDAVIAGSIVRVSSGTDSASAEGMRQSLGTGGFAVRCLGDHDTTVLGKTSSQYSQQVRVTNYLGQIKTTVAGVDSEIVSAGSKLTTVAAGNLSTTVGAGNLALTCGVNAVYTSGANMSITSGANATITASAAVTSTSGGVNSMIGTVANITAPVVKIGSLISGVAVAGIPGPTGPFMDYVTGLPVRGVATLTIG